MIFLGRKMKDDEMENYTGADTFQRLGKERIMKAYN
jgi:hypothetical protein